MARVRVGTYTRRLHGKRFRVHSYSRKKRPIGKKRIISKTPVKLYAIQDEFGQKMGWSTKPGKRRIT